MGSSAMRMDESGEDMVLMEGMEWMEGKLDGNLRMMVMYLCKFSLSSKHAK